MAELKWGEPTDGWRLSVSFDKEVYKAGEPIVAVAVFQNLAFSPQPYGAQGREFDYVLDCRNDRNQEVPLTLYGKRIKDNRGEGRFINAELAPQGQLVCELELWRHLDLSMPGKYALRVSREVFPHQGLNQPPVVSNSCTFEVHE